MAASPNLVAQVYVNVGTGFPPSTHRDCACEFEYHYRWPQFYGSFLAGDPTAVEILDERDRALEQHFHERCDAGEFEYPTRWEQFYEGLLAGDRAVAVGILDERDRALESHIAAMRCFGVDYAHGVTCEFEYPTRWPQVVEGLLSGTSEDVRVAVGLLQVRDIDLETHLSTRVCGNVDVHGLHPDLVTQVYVNVT
jgi:hypothetical protein